MRIATLIIGLAVSLIILVQSCAASVGGSLAADEETSGAGGAGFIVALLFIFGAAFALTHPRVSLTMFVLAALIAIPTGATTDFGDLLVWGVLAVVLAGLSFFSYRRRRTEVPRAAEAKPPPAP